MPIISRGYLTGVGRTTYELVTALDKMKEEIPFDIVLYSQNTKNISSKNLGFSFESKHISLPYRESTNRILSFFSIREYFAKADLWHCPHNSDWVGRLSKTIFTIHDLIILNCKNEFPWKEVEKVKKELPPLLHQCKAIITCSESSKNDLIRFFDIDPDKIHVTYWGVRHDLFKPLTDKEDIKSYLWKKYNINKPYFFSVSCGYGRKNTLQLLEAYLQLLKNNPDNDLVVIWNNYGEDVIQLLEKSKDRIHILNNVRDEDLVRLYSAATSLFFPSSYEGFGLPILESMACGIPVVTCDNSSLREVGGEVAIYTPSPDVSDLKKVMENFENGNYNVASLSNKGIERASTFTWKKCARETLDIYKKQMI
ncbi:glycosyl transferase [Bacteroidia bacterium]|nr:glycosyl transferase [Bacteroidia bacterium]